MTFTNTKEENTSEMDFEYKTELKIDENTLEMELLDFQIYDNIAVIPIKTKASKMDILTVKKGFELGLINIAECPESRVNQIIVENNSISPLLLIDGDEILGAKQNRIVNSSTLVAAKTKISLSVSCVEQGRWAYSESFKHSPYIANSITRGVKAKARYEDRDAQSDVWNSINSLEMRNSFCSETHAMSESYDRQKNLYEKYIDKFKRVKGQTGAMVFVNGEFRGMDIFINPQIYREYHEKILKSYIIDKEETSAESFNKHNIAEKALETLKAMGDCEIKKNKTDGIGRSISFSNEIGTGSALIYKGEILHIPFLKHPEIDSPEIEEIFI